MCLFASGGGCDHQEMSQAIQSPPVNNSKPQDSWRWRTFPLPKWSPGNLFPFPVRPPPPALVFQSRINCSHCAAPAAARSRLQGNISVTVNNTSMGSASNAAVFPVYILSEGLVDGCGRTSSMPCPSVQG